jgi:hypothetical protein
MDLNSGYDITVRFNGNTYSNNPCTYSAKYTVILGSTVLVDEILSITDTQPEHRDDGPDLYHARVTHEMEFYTNSSGKLKVMVEILESDGYRFFTGIFISQEKPAGDGPLGTENPIELVLFIIVILSSIFALVGGWTVALIVGVRLFKSLFSDLFAGMKSKERIEKIKHVCPNCEQVYTRRPDTCEICGEIQPLDPDAKI